MKKKVLIRNLSMLLGVTAMVSFSSCLKDKNYVDFSAVGTLVELPLSAKGIQTQSFEISTTPATFQIAVNVASPKPLTSDLNVTVAVDAAALTAYNDSHDGLDFELLPAVAYSIAKPTVTVPANQRLAYVTVTINSSVIDPAKAYALPITLTDASGQTINANYKSLITVVGVKNKYDGVYNVKGEVTRNSATGPDMTLGGKFKNFSYTLVTKDGISDSFSQLWATKAGIAGIDGTYVQVDPATSKAIVRSSNATMTNIAGYDSRYDATTKTFYLAFTWGVAPNTRLAVDTMVYVGPR